MAVKTYSLKKDGDKKITENFAVREFRCKDGTDTILIDEKLVTLLQKLRDKFSVINISSAYRTEKYNKQIGGVANSQHLYGKAADCVFAKNVNLSDVADYAQRIGFTGIGLDDKYQNFVHLDTRNYKSFFRYNASGSTYSVQTFLKEKNFTEPKVNVKSGDTGENVKWVQSKLLDKGYSLTVDGIFGKNTEKSVIAFQKSQGLVADGIVGRNTRNKLK